MQSIPDQTRNVKYLWNAETRTSSLLCPFKGHNNEFKQALEHRKWHAKKYIAGRERNS
jgi:hypothetical protein